MTKIKYSALVSDMRGKLNGSVMSKNTYGSYVRTKVTPVNPSSVPQQLVRGLFTIMSQNWRVLTQAQIDSWNNVVDQWKTTNVLGDTLVYTGFNLFGKLNRNLQTIGEAIKTTGTFPDSRPSQLLDSITVDTTGGFLKAKISKSDAKTANIIRATAPQSAGKNFVKSEFRIIKIVNPSVDADTDIKASYIATFGALPPVGTKVFISLSTISKDTGAPGSDFTLSAVAV